MSAEPRRNRVSPRGELLAVSARGALMGNRGLLHDEQGRIRRDFRLKAWITCLLEFKGRRREIMQPGKYTELFFLDEATSLAAGHRPCAECRRADYNRFRATWAEGAGLEQPPRAPGLDERLHADRLTHDGAKRTYGAAAGDLPDGTFVAGIDLTASDRPHLLWRGQPWAWSPVGYEGSSPIDASVRVRVLTPRSTVAAFVAGYVPATALD